MQLTWRPQAGKVYKACGIVYTTSVRNGYYVGKAMDPVTIEHREAMTPVLAFLDAHPELFVVYFQDETQFSERQDVC
jgi:hypothetical protein